MDKITPFGVICEDHEYEWEEMSTVCDDVYKWNKERVTMWIGLKDKRGNDGDGSIWIEDHPKVVEKCRHIIQKRIDTAKIKRKLSKLKSQYMSFNEKMDLIIKENRELKLQLKRALDKTNIERKEVTITHRRA